ncbi:hypothetical protein MLD38_010308 [Melastoma candidum]|uniref:Uncharacterized protein n=1 Tax=Melastoma candidum TaxID=119954 RepID=A0ACB9R2H8_9MYRT|nr:hypothetical protein MLD38_010308 [Melastoma candidum]
MHVVSHLLSLAKEEGEEGDLRQGHRLVRSISNVSIKPHRRRLSTSPAKTNAPYGGGSPAKTNAPYGGGSPAKTNVPYSPAKTYAPYGGSPVKTNAPYGSSPAKTNAPFGGSPVKTNAPSGGSAANVAAPSGGSAANVAAPSGGPAVGFTVFDVTQFGAQTDEYTDNAMFFIRAWNAACKSGKPAKLLIPSGTFISSPVVFQGPCNNTVPMEVEIRGTIQASSDISSYVSDEWFGFELVDGLNVRGGTFDGQGESVWAMAGCVPSQPCQHLPISLKFSKSKNVYVEGVTSLNSMDFTLLC